ncbi:MAG: hypothetical protein IKE24_01315 [Clostridia bacterium]|nr:hypothetical protein [Clostridia bacterium]
MKEKKLPLTGAVLWILGLALFLIGLNIHSDVGSWLSVIGNICFFVGLGIEGVVWMRNRRSASGEDQKEA